MSGDILSVEGWFEFPFEKSIISTKTLKNGNELYSCTFNIKSLHIIELCQLNIFEISCVFFL